MKKQNEIWTVPDTGRGRFPTRTYGGRLACCAKGTVIQIIIGNELDLHISVLYDSRNTFIERDLE